jgi:excinuclease ABC subunit B
MRRAIDETNRRRAKQTAYNEEHGITPRGITKEIRSLSDRIRASEGAVEGAIAADGALPLSALPREEALKMIKELEAQMRRASKELEFEKAAALRDQIVELRRATVE